MADSVWAWRLVRTTDIDRFSRTFPITTLYKCLKIIEHYGENKYSGILLRCCTIPYDDGDGKSEGSEEYDPRQYPAGVLATAVHEPVDHLEEARQGDGSDRRPHPDILLVGVVVVDQQTVQNLVNHRQKDVEQKATQTMHQFAHDDITSTDLPTIE